MKRRLKIVRVIVLKIRKIGFFGRCNTFETFSYTVSGTTIVKTDCCATENTRPILQNPNIFRHLAKFPSFKILGHLVQSY